MADAPADIVVTDQPLSRAELARLVRGYFDDMVKYVVDVRTGRIAVGGELHADGENLLIEAGSEQRDLWGANYYPGRGAEGCIEYTALINIRPSQDNRGMEVGRSRGSRAHPGHHLGVAGPGGSVVTAAQHGSLTPARWARFSREQQVLMVANEVHSCGETVRAG
jgi:hypothetical protein